MGNYLTSMLLFLQAAIIATICVKILIKTFQTKNNIVLWVLPSAYALFMIVMVVIPIGMFSFSQLFQNSPMGIDSDETFRMYMGSILISIFYIAWQVGYFFIHKPNSILKTQLEYTSAALRASEPSMGFYFIMAITMAAWVAYTILFPRHYGHHVNSLAFEQNLSEAGGYGVLYVLSILSVYFPPALVVALAFAIHHKKKRGIIIFGMLFFCMQLVHATFGRRAMVANPFAQLGILLLLLGYKRLFLIGSVAGVFLLMLISPIMLQYRVSPDAFQGGIGEKVVALGKAYRNTFSGEVITSTKPWEFSGSDVTFTAGLAYEYVKREGICFLVPYYGILATPIPRAIWYDKPYASSVDGTQSGLPPFLLAREWRGSSATELSVSAAGGACMYMQFGFIGVIGGGLLAGILCRSIGLWVLSYGPFGAMLLLNFILWAVLLNAGGSPDTLLLRSCHEVIPAMFMLIVARTCSGKIPGQRFGNPLAVENELWAINHTASIPLVK